MTKSDRRLVENEAMFRGHNEAVLGGLEELIEDMEREGIQEGLIPITDKLHFFCECFDINCNKRVAVKPRLYRKIHKNRHNFLIYPGHENRRIERVVKSTGMYSIVEKLVPISEPKIEFPYPNITRGLYA